MLAEVLWVVEVGPFMSTKNPNKVGGGQRNAENVTLSVNNIFLIVTRTTHNDRAIIYASRVL